MSAHAPIEQPTWPELLGPPAFAKAEQALAGMADAQKVTFAALVIGKTTDPRALPTLRFLAREIETLAKVLERKANDGLGPVSFSPAALRALGPAATEACQKARAFETHQKPKKGDA